MYGKCECFVLQMLYVCVLCASCGSSQCCVLHDLQVLMLVEGKDAALWNASFKLTLFGCVVSIMCRLCIP